MPEPGAELPGSFLVVNLRKAVRTGHSFAAVSGNNLPGAFHPGLGASTAKPIGIRLSQWALGQAGEGGRKARSKEESFAPISSESEYLVTAHSLNLPDDAGRLRGSTELTVEVLREPFMSSK
jgi:hypothetical protein